MTGWLSFCLSSQQITSQPRKARVRWQTYQISTAALMFVLCHSVANISLTFAFPQWSHFDLRKTTTRLVNRFCKRNSEKEHEAAREKTSKYFHWNFCVLLPFLVFFCFVHDLHDSLEKTKIFNECFAFLPDSFALPRSMSTRTCVLFMAEAERGAQFSWWSIFMFASA